MTFHPTLILYCHISEGPSNVAAKDDDNIEILESVDIQQPSPTPQVQMPGGQLPKGNSFNPQFIF